MAYEDTLRDEIRSLGVRRALFGIEFYLSLFITVIAGISMFAGSLRPETVTSMSCAFTTASGAMLGLCMVAFSVVLSFSGDRVMLSAFFKGKSFTAVKIDFSITSIVSGACIIFSLFTIIFSEFLDAKWISLLLSVSIFFFLWEVLNMIMLMTNTVRLLSNFKAFCILNDEKDS